MGIDLGDLRKRIDAAPVGGLAGVVTRAFLEQVERELLAARRGATCIAEQIARPR